MLDNFWFGVGVMYIWIHRNDQPIYYENKKSLRKEK